MSVKELLATVPNTASGVQQAIQMGGTGKIAVALMQWSGYGTYSVSIGWTVLDCNGAADELAQTIEATARMPGGSAPSTAMTFAGRPAPRCAAPPSST